MRYEEYEPSPQDKFPELDLKVRAASSEADLAAAADLSGRYTGEDPSEALQNARQHISGNRNVVYVACLPDGEIVGYARITWVGKPDAAPPNVAPAGYYLGGMAVDHQYRRRGVGRRLTEARMENLRYSASEAWYLVNSANTASIDLHKALGFHESTRDFVFPGVVFDGPGGILCHIAFSAGAGTCPGCGTFRATP